MKSIIIAPIIFTALAGFAQAAGYVMDLEGKTPIDELVPNYPDLGLDGWVQSEENNNPELPMAWIAGMGTSNGIGFGPVFDAPSFEPFFIRRNVSLGMAGSSLFMNMQFVQDFSFSSHNDFYIALNDPSHNPLFTLNFIADPTLYLIWNMNINGQDSFGSVVSMDLYELSLSFFGIGTEIVYNINVGQRNTWPSFDDGVVSGDTDLVIGSLEFGATTGSLSQEWGYNYMTFADVSLIPEPSTSVLSALSIFGLLVRRKRA